MPFFSLFRWEIILQRNVWTMCCWCIAIIRNDVKSSTQQRKKWAEGWAKVKEGGGGRGKESAIKYDGFAIKWDRKRNVGSRAKINKN